VANVDEQFRMPDGSVYLVRHPASESDGAFVEMEFILPTGCVPPPPHVHPSQVEDYEILEGSFEVVIAGVWQTLNVGDRASVPVGALHTFRNRSGATVRIRNCHTPAVRFEEFIEQTHHVLSTTGVTRKRDPRIAPLLAAVMLDFGDTLFPGRARERIPMQALAVLGRRLAPDSSARPSPSTSDEFMEAGGSLRT
jgi:mannose-6-phosphate isomerase-like protein (cupin superfamily)